MHRELELNEETNAQFQLQIEDITAQARETHTLLAATRDALQYSNDQFDLLEKESANRSERATGELNAALEEAAKYRIL